jgi:hypothetical protein
MIKSKYNAHNCAAGIMSELQLVHNQRFGKVSVEDYRTDHKQIAKRFNNFRGAKYKHMSQLVSGNIANQEYFFQREETILEEGDDDEITVLDAKNSTPKSMLFRNQSAVSLARPKIALHKKIQGSRELLSQKSSGSKTYLKDEQSSIYSQRPTTAQPIKQRNKDSFARIGSSKSRHNLRISSSNTVVSRPFTGMSNKLNKVNHHNITSPWGMRRGIKSGYRPESAATADIDAIVDQELENFEKNI